MSGSASEHLEIACGRSVGDQAHIDKALVLVQEAITRLETIRDLSAIGINNNAAIHEDAVVALAALKGNT